MTKQPTPMELRPRDPAEFAGWVDEWMSAGSWDSQSLAHILGTEAKVVNRWLDGSALPRGRLQAALEKQMNVKFNLFDARSFMRTPIIRPRNTTKSKRVSDDKLIDLLLSTIELLSHEGKKRVLECAIKEVTQ